MREDSWSSTFKDERALKTVSSEAGNVYVQQGGERKVDFEFKHLQADKASQDIINEIDNYKMVLVHEASKFDIDYFGHMINKVENPEWCVFPWEEWW